ncbi:cytochrome c oxidase subunit 3 [Guptibacillus hwajinpoensis]|uniref:cytochrome c oxidase subunit 3 n=1 Tax=Guptibacillus hwajinpoensis TaxID=208199 RepID=UPI001883A17D|nr:cytochrome c oxidase subunit 3 [Pseudalkalibacillus hwajinpoensis]MBF0708311.1 cytochrome c oxidase subunit 3 [Pseudalkalibacillus hwajinpoensis]WLR59630.1 cytochrome c oxidase subunit 3 [Pseudalkalibacillus hwajinpoensis]
MKSNETMTKLPANPERATLDGKNKFLGFWFFLGGETVLFASLFGVYLGLRNATNGGVSANELFELPLVFIATMLLLTSSLTSVFATMALKTNHFKRMIGWFVVTGLLGLAFLGLEIYEFNHYVHEYGHTIKSSAWGSAFYTLVGTHGAHVFMGISWITLLIIRNLRRGMDLYTAPKFYLFALYWHFIDVVWIFIFTVVYLMGKVG